MKSSREQFEEWYLENWGHTEDDHETLFERDPDCPEDYYRLGVRLAHHAWQASRAAIVIERPEFIDSRQALNKGFTVDYSNGFGDAMDAYEAAIEAAQIKVKP